MTIREKLIGAGASAKAPQRREFDKAYVVAIAARLHMDDITDLSGILEFDDNGEPGVTPADLFSPAQLRPIAARRGISLDHLQLQEIHHQMSTTPLNTLEEIHRTYLVIADSMTIGWHDRYKEGDREVREVNFLLGMDIYLGALGVRHNSVQAHNTGAKDAKGNDLNRRRGLSLMMTQIDPETRHVDSTLRLRIESHIRVEAKLRGTDISLNSLREEHAGHQGITLVNQSAERPQDQKPS